jgi:hypothetical protein
VRRFDGDRFAAAVANRRNLPDLSPLALMRGTIDDLRQEPQQRQHRLATHGVLR